MVEHAKLSGLCPPGRRLEEFLGMLFTSSGRTEQQINRQISAASAGMRTLLWPVVMMRQLSHKTSVSLCVPTPLCGSVVQEKFSVEPFLLYTPPVDVVLAPR